MTKEPSSEPTVEEILDQVQRRREASKEAARASTPARSLSSTERRLIIIIDRVIFWFGRHWLFFFNLAAFLYIGLPFLAPLLMHLGKTGAGEAIYALYRPLCHQLPYRSWFLFGSQMAYGWETLYEIVGVEGVSQHGYIGDAVLGYKVALCQRDVAIYGVILLAGLFFALVRRRAKPIPLWVYLVFGIIPIGLDGGLQMITQVIQLLLPSSSIPVLESNPLRRTITGALFGLCTVWLAYPTVEEAVSDMLTTLEKRFGWQR